MKNFSELLKERRLAVEMTQRQIAGMLGITERSYQNYEFGSREPALSKLVALADILQVSIDYLLGRTDDPKLHRL